MTTEHVPATIDAGITPSDVLRTIQTGDTQHVKILQEDPEAIARRIDAQIIDAVSADEVLGGSSVLHAQDYLDTPFSLRSVTFRPSDQGSLPFFAVLTIVDAAGELITMTCGARTVMLKAAVLADRGWLPRWVKIVEDGKTAAGNVPLNLVAATDPTDTDTF